MTQLSDGQVYEILGKKSPLKYRVGTREKAHKALQNNGLRKFDLASISPNHLMSMATDKNKVELHTTSGFADLLSPDAGTDGTPSGLPVVEDKWIPPRETGSLGSESRI